MGRIYAGVLGPLAFVVIVVLGLLHGSDAEKTMLAGCCLMFVFAAIGFVIGQLAEWMIEDAVRSRLRGELAAQQVARSSGRTPEGRPGSSTSGR